MKTLLALFLLALGASYFATRAMADAVILGPNGVAVGMHHDRHGSDKSMRHAKIHGDDVDDHSHHADRGHEGNHAE